MFGYVHTDTPYLYIKDKTLYEAMYCGVCKGIAEVCGHAARFALSYDVTFLSVILHNILGEDVRIEKSHCMTHCIRSKMMAKTDELTRKLGALNTLLAYYKYTDDIMDEGKGRGKRFLFKKGYKRAKKAYPEIEDIVKKNLAKQEEVEKTQTDSIDRAADSTAKMLAQFADYALGDKASEHTYNLFYAVGKWIYLIDALDDYEKDIKKGAYNPFYLAYGADSRCALLKGKSGEEVQFAFHAIFYDIRESLAEIPFRFNHDLSDNILLRGLPKITKNVMSGCYCQKDRKRETEDTNM
ncbi:MAG: hypothetical protein IJ329_03230 [Clostridia bacterium]|nr:hypothetical protein [Clostridia bacterium]